MDGAARHLRAAAIGLAALGLIVVAAWSAARLSGGTVSSAVAASPASQDSAARTIEIHIVGRKYSYSEPRIEVQENDLLKITFETTDIPHSFTVDEYRIAKRATPGHPAVFEFRADKAGTFRFYCNLTQDAGCKGMHGELVVKPRSQ